MMEQISQHMQVQELTLPRPGDGVSMSEKHLAVNGGPQCCFRYNVRAAMAPSSPLITILDRWTS